MADTPTEETTLETKRLLLEHAPLLLKDLADERLYRFIRTDAPQSVEALRRSGYVEGPDIEDDALGAYIRTENFEEREQERGYLDLAVLEYMKEQW